MPPNTVCHAWARPSGPSGPGPSSEHPPVGPRNCLPWILATRLSGSLTLRGSRKGDVQNKVADSAAPPLVTPAVRAGAHLDARRGLRDGSRLTVSADAKPASGMTVEMIRASLCRFAGFLPASRKDDKESAGRPTRLKL